ncbi:MAG TPA: hypothetical protein VM537_10535 [Anaerolineae bacterium]|nr:hypothetical protein [Anaerolineae bacterium]
MMDKPSVCVDFDGVIASWNLGSFHTPGPPIPGSREFLEELSRFARIVIWTCRTNAPLYDGQPVEELVGGVQGWLDLWGLSQYVSEIYAGGSKPFVACYIDDKAIHCEPEIRSHHCGYTATLVKARAMCANGKQFCSKEEINA